MRRLIWLAGIVLAVFSYPAHAQNNVARVVTTCGTVSPFPTVGKPAPLTVDVNGNICGGAGGGGGGAATIADGADIAQGTTTDGACAGDATSGCTVLSRLSRIAARLGLLTGSKAPGTAAANSLLGGGLFSLVPVVMTDGQQAAAQMSLSGAARIMPGANWPAAITWTTATAQNTDLMLSCGDSPAQITANVVGSGTISTGALSFQYSDDNTDCTGATGTWANIPVSNVQNKWTFAPLTNAYTLTALSGGGTQPFLLFPNNSRSIKVRLTTAITGAGGQIVITPTIGASRTTDPALQFPIAAGNAVIGAVNPFQGSAALSATNGLYSNLLQGNAVLSTSNPVFNRPVAGATGGGTISSAIAPATPAGVNLKASAGTVLKVFATTIQATPVYVKLYNASSAPTCGSGTPVARFMVPAASTAANGAGTNVDLGDIGAAFGTGIGYCVTGALADNDTTAITAANTLVNIIWN